MKIGFTDFFVWALTGRLAQFYESLRWSSWREDIVQLSGDRRLSFYPFLWTKEGSVMTSRREQAPVQEVFDLKVDLLRQLTEKIPGETREGTNSMAD